MMKSGAIIISLLMFNLGAALTMQEKQYIEQMKKEGEYELKLEKQAEEQHAIHKSANELVAGKVTPKQIVATRRGGDKQGAVRATLKKEINKEHRRMKDASRRGDVWEANRAYSEMTEAAQKLGKDVLKSHKGSLGATKMSLMEELAESKEDKMKRLSFEKQAQMMMDERKTPEEVGLNPKHVQKFLKSHPDQQKVQQYEVSKDLRKQVKEGKVPNPVRAADDFMREANIPHSVRKEELKKQDELKKQQEKAEKDLQETLQRQKDDAAWTAMEFAKLQKRQHLQDAKMNTRPQLRKRHEQEALKEADHAKSAQYQKNHVKKSDYEAQLMKQRVKKTSHPLKPRMKDLLEQNPLTSAVTGAAAATMLKNLKELNSATESSLMEQTAETHSDESFKDQVEKMLSERKYPGEVGLDSAEVLSYLQTDYPDPAVVQDYLMSMESSDLTVKADPSSWEHKMWPGAAHKM